MKNILIYTCLTLILAACGQPASNSRKGDNRQNEEQDTKPGTGEYLFKPIERSMITRVGTVNRLAFSEVRAALKENKLSGDYALFPTKIQSSKIASRIDDIAAEVECGKNTTFEFKISDRIKNCKSINSIPSSARTWEGTVSGVSGEGVWRLVSYIQEKKVWLDESTGLLWSDIVKVDTFDIAIDNLCKSNTDSLLPSLGMIPVKNVIWRLPNKQEVLQAYLNGSSGVLSLPDSADSQLFWTVSYAEDDKAWAIDEATGALSKVATSVQLNIRCIGVVIE